MKNKKLEDYLIESQLKALHYSRIAFCERAKDNANRIGINAFYDNDTLCDISLSNRAFVNLIGVEEFALDDCLSQISSKLKEGSEVVFEHSKTPYPQIERMLSKYNLLVYERMTDVDMQKELFDYYNATHNDRLYAISGVSFILAVKKEHLVY